MLEPKCMNCKFYKKQNCIKFSSPFYMMRVEKDNTCGKFEPKKIEKADKKSNK